MDIQDLKPADILLFSGEKGSLISKAIMFLTDSPVSHAALAYEPSTEIVEETPPAVQKNLAAQRFEGRTIYVKRLTSGPRDMEPVLSAAKGYLNDQEPYAKSSLYLVGMLLLYKKFTPHTLTQKVMIKIFKKLAGFVIDQINKDKYPGKLPMVCSQFVYQCYSDGGPDYRLRIKDGTLVGATILAGREHLSVLDQAIHRVKTDRSSDFVDVLQSNTLPASGGVPTDPDEELARELLDSFQAVEAAAADELTPELVVAIHEFAQAIHQASTGVASPPSALLGANGMGTAPDALNLLKTEEAYFVAPGDLLSHCENTIEVGIIDG